MRRNKEHVPEKEHFLIKNPSSEESDIIVEL